MKLLTCRRDGECLCNHNLHQMNSCNMSETIETWASPPGPPPESILQEAHRLVYGERKDDYGDARDEARKIAAGWSVIFGCDVNPEHCALAMAWLKIVRQTNKAKRDNLVDLAGYAGLAEKVQEGR